MVPLRLADPGQFEDKSHAMGSQVRVRKEPCLVGEHQLTGEMDDRPSGFETVHHAEMVLVTGQIGHEDHPGLVEIRGVGEDVSTEGKGRLRGRVGARILSNCSVSPLSRAWIAAEAAGAIKSKAPRKASLCRSPSPLMVDG